MLELRGVSKTVLGKPHIHTTDLTFQSGTMNVLLGPTLSGKTTLMRLMAGLDEPTEGTIHAHGKDVTGVKVQDRKIAMVYQQFINYPNMTVYENIASPMRLMGKSKAEMDKAVRGTADMLRLTPMLDRKPLELSGGQQQRCALARALVKDSDLVLLDEPLANLDYKLREELREEIPKIFQESGAIFVYATTEPEEALLLGGNTATLWEGRITQFGPAPEVYRNPKDAVTARVYSDPPMNFAPCSKQGNSLSFGEGIEAPADGPFATLSDGQYQAGFRPNHLRLEARSASAVPFRCTLGIAEITGSETFLHLRHGQDNWVALIHVAHHFEPGSEIDLWLEPEHVYLFDADGALVQTAAYAAAA